MSSCSLRNMRGPDRRVAVSLIIQGERLLLHPAQKQRYFFLFHLKFSNLQYFCGSLPVNHLVYIFARNYELNISPSLLFFLLLLGFLQFLSEHRTTY